MFCAASASAAAAASAAVSARSSAVARAICSAGSRSSPVKWLRSYISMRGSLSDAARHVVGDFFHVAQQGLDVAQKVVGGGGRDDVAVVAVGGSGEVLRRVGGLSGCGTHPVILVYQLVDGFPSQLPFGWGRRKLTILRWGSDRLVTGSPALD